MWLTIQEHAKLPQIWRWCRHIWASILIHPRVEYKDTLNLLQSDKEDEGEVHFLIWLVNEVIKETTWSLTIDDIVHHQQKLNRGLKHQISLLDRSQVTSNYSMFGNLRVWIHHHQETIWCKFEHNQKCWMNETFIASISALFDIFSKIQVATFYRVKMQYARCLHAERLVKLHWLAQWVKWLKLSDRRLKKIKVTMIHIRLVEDLGGVHIAAHYIIITDSHLISLWYCLDDKW